MIRSCVNHTKYFKYSMDLSWICGIRHTYEYNIMCRFRDCLFSRCQPIFFCTYTKCSQNKAKKILKDKHIRRRLTFNQFNWFNRHQRTLFSIQFGFAWLRLILLVIYRVLKQTNKQKKTIEKEKFYQIKCGVHCYEMAFQHLIKCIFNEIANNFTCRLDCKLFHHRNTRPIPITYLEFYGTMALWFEIFLGFMSYTLYTDCSDRLPESHSRMYKVFHG